MSAEAIAIAGVGVALLAVRITRYPRPLRPSANRKAG